MYYASVLPFAIDPDGQVWLLLGQERHAAGRASSDRWSDFGGMSEPGETLKQAAARECFEESMGLFGTRHQIEARLDDALAFAATGPKGGRQFLMSVPFEQSLVEHFARFYHYARCAAALHAVTQADNTGGLFEKQAIAWVRLSDVAELDRTGRLPLRFWFRETILQQLFDSSTTMLHRLANDAAARQCRQK